jgi:hypothetical protein
MEEINLDMKRSPSQLVEAVPPQRLRNFPASKISGFKDSRGAKPVLQKISHDGNTA